MLKSSTMVTLALVLGCAAAIGCSHTQAAPKTAPTDTTGASATKLTPKQEQAVDKAHQEVGGTGLGIDDEILKLCPSVKPPRFDFDSSKVKDQFKGALVELASCMKSGGLSGKSVLLIGHSDPRGEEDYNMALGGRRAESVRDALQSLEIATSRLDVSSRGELDASGTDESGWSKDRRVDIKLKK